MTTNKNTGSGPSSLSAPVSAGANPHSHTAPAHPLYRKVSGDGRNSPNFDEAPAGLKPIGGVLAGIIAGLPVPE